MKLSNLLRAAKIFCFVFLVFQLLFVHSAFAGRKKPFLSEAQRQNPESLCIDDSENDLDLKTKREEYCRLSNSLRLWHLADSLKLDQNLSESAQSQAKIIYEKKAHSSQGFFSQAYNLVVSNIKSSLNIKNFGLQLGLDEEEPNEIIKTHLEANEHRKVFYNHQYRKIGIGFYKGIWVSLLTE